MLFMIRFKMEIFSKDEEVDDIFKVNIKLFFLEITEKCLWDQK